MDEDCGEGIHYCALISELYLCAVLFLECYPQVYILTYIYIWVYKLSFC